MPAKLKLTDEQVKQIRRRIRAGERLSDLAEEFNVNRKTIWRRLRVLERAETERAQRVAAKRLRSQAAREWRKLLDRERDAGLSARDRRNAGARHDPYLEWLDTRKNLSGPALAEARGLILVRNSGGTIRKWCERSEIDALLEAGWLLA